MPSFCCNSRHTYQSNYSTALVNYQSLEDLPVAQSFKDDWRPRNEDHAAARCGHRSIRSACRSRTGFAADSSGEDLPIGDFGPWKQVFTEDFLLDAALGEFVAKYDDKWKARGANWDFDQRNPGQVPVADTSRRGIYSPANTLSVSSGVLDIAPHKGDGPQFGPDGRLEQNEWPELVDLPWEQERPYVAALTPRVLGPDGEMTYGRFTVRLKVEYPEDNPAGGEGYKIANLLWPKSDLWPDDGEIDYPEGDFSDNSFSAFHHYTCDATKVFLKK